MHRFSKRCDQQPRAIWRGRICSLGTLTALDSTFTGNSVNAPLNSRIGNYGASSLGGSGGIYNGNNGTVLLEQCTFSGNTLINNSGGGVEVSGGGVRHRRQRTAQRDPVHSVRQLGH